MITGSTIAVGGILVHQLWEGFFINGQMFWGIAMGASSLVYILVSLLGKRQEFNLDKMLHRGEYSKEEEMKIIDPVPQKGWKVLGMGKEFTKGDKLIYIVTYVWTFAWVIVFIIGTVFNLTGTISDNSWMEFWYYYVIIQVIASVIVIIWFTIGGIKDVKIMLYKLKTMTRDAKDDGFVVDHKNLDEA